MKITLGGLIVLVALSSAVFMLGTTKYAPQPRTNPIEPATRKAPEEFAAPRREQAEVKRPKRPSAADIQVQPGVKPAVTNEVTLYVPRATGDDIRLFPVRQKLGEEATPLAALKALATYSGPEDSILPEGTKVLGLRVGATGLAIADFSREIVDNFPGGSRTEQLLLASIVDTLTQFRTVSRVVITVEGKSVDSIGGHIDLEEPLTRDMSLVAQSE